MDSLKDLKDPRRRDDLAAARAVLKKNSMMLLTTSKAYVRHPELSAARENRDFACKQMCDAVNMISDVAQAAGISDVHPYERQGELAAALNELDVSRMCFVVFIPKSALLVGAVEYAGCTSGWCKSPSIGQP